ncbi:MAG: hypothetical protein ABWJ99_07740 [Caldimicrobium sp.]
MFEELKVKDFPPRGFFMEVEAPSECKECLFFREHPEKVCGIRILTPYSAFSLKGCISSIPCPVKNFQLAHFGLGLPFSVISTFEKACLNALRGEVEEEKEINFKELVELSKKICGYLEKEKEIEILLPHPVKRLIYYLLSAEFSGVITYLLLHYEMIRPVVFKDASCELEEVFYASIDPEKDLKVDTKELLRVEILTLGGEILFQHERLFIIRENEIRPLPGKSAFALPEEYFLKYQGKEEELFESITELSTLIDDYLKAVLGASEENDREKLLTLGKEVEKMLKIKTYLTGGIITLKKEPSKQEKLSDLSSNLSL